MTESFSTEDGRRLAYRREGAGPLLVCHPGGPGLSGAEFGDLAGLTGSFELVLLDPRGTGGSDRPSDASAYELFDYVGDLEELREQLEADRINLLGMSHGGMAAIAYAAAHPQRVERLVLVGALACLGPEHEAELERGLAARAREPWFADARAALDEEQSADFADDEALAANLARQWPLYFGSYGDVERAYTRSIAADIPNGDALRYFNEHVWPTFDLRDELARIDAPTLVVAGERDFIAGPASAKTIADGIATAEVVLFPGVGHFPFVEARDRFREEVTRFLA